jgi:hypothetical protein
MISSTEDCSVKTYQSGKIVKTSHFDGLERVEKLFSDGTVKVQWNELSN